MGPKFQDSQTSTDMNASKKKICIMLFKKKKLLFKIMYQMPSNYNSMPCPFNRRCAPLSSCTLRHILLPISDVGLPDMIFGGDRLSYDNKT